LTRDAEPRVVIVFADEGGNEPFTEWINDMRDKVGRKRILARVARLEQGNFGDCEPVGDGISELKMDFGPGYRCYFGEEGSRLVVLLCGGDKGSQKRDIEAAKRYWKEYKADAKT